MLTTSSRSSRPNLTQASPLTNTSLAIFFSVKPNVNQQTILKIKRALAIEPTSCRLIPKIPIKIRRLDRAHLGRIDPPNNLTALSPPTLLRKTRFFITYNLLRVEIHFDKFNVAPFPGEVAEAADGADAVRAGLDVEEADDAFRCAVPGNEGGEQCVGSEGVRPK